MTNRADVTRLRAHTAQVTALAQRDLDRFWAGLDLSNPDATRDALLVYLPSLVTTYGDIASTVAADWYETVRAQQVTGRPFSALTVETDSSAATGSVRYAVGHLYTDSPAATLPVLAGAVQRYVSNASRSTIASNTARDPAKPRYARITDGKSCAWCTLLSSRGFVYHSEDTAGAGASEFHDHDGCTIVADWSKEPAIAGYHPGRLRDLYTEARDSEFGGNDDRSIAAAMRRLHPDLFTDGVVPHDH